MFKKFFSACLLIIALFFMCNNLYAAGRYIRIDKCILVYSHADASGNAYLNLKGLNELFPKTNGIKFIFGENSTTLYAERKQVETAIKAFIKCNE